MEIPQQDTIEPRFQPLASQAARGSAGTSTPNSPSVADDSSESLERSSAACRELSQRARSDSQAEEKARAVPTDRSADEAPKPGASPLIPDWDNAQLLVAKSAGTGSKAESPPVEPLRNFEDLDPSSFVLDRPSQEPQAPQQPVFDWIADSPESIWYVRNRAGGQYGPAAGAVMRTWLQEGRVSRDCYVWREGWANWRRAGGVFPQWSTARSEDRLAAAGAVSASLPQNGPAGQTTVPSKSIQPQTSAASSRAEEPPLAAAGGRPGSRWLFRAILLLTLALGCVAFTAVVILIRSQQESFPGWYGDGPDQEKPPEVFEPIIH